MSTPRRALVAVALAAALGAAACKSAPTEIVLRVVNDPAAGVSVPAGVDAIRLRVADAGQPAMPLFDHTFTLCAMASQTDCFSLPLSFTLVPGPRHPDGATRVQVTALKAGARAIDDAVIVPFQRETSVHVDVVLYAACAGRDCASLDQACTADGTCHGIAPPGPDLAAPADLAGADFAGADFAAPDLATAADLSAMPDLTVADLGGSDTVLTWTPTLYDVGTFYGVWADASHVLAVGDSGGQGPIWYHNGPSESANFNPDPRYSGTTTMHGIAALTSSDAWAVGDGLVLHLSAGVWIAESTGLPSYVQRGVWVGGPQNDVWVGGGNPGTPGSETFDDAHRNAVQFPTGTHWGLNTGTAGYARKAVWGDGAGGVIIAAHGSYTRYTLANATLITVAFSAGNVYGVFGLSMSNAWLVGDSGGIWHFDVNGGSPLVAPEIVTPPTTAAFLGVHGTPGHLWAACADGTIYHSTGSGTWTKQTNLGLAGIPVFEAVYAVAPNDVYVVGNYASQKLVLHGN
jgi:hypothetical protein